MTTGHIPQPASRDQAGLHLAAVAASFTGHGIATRLSRIGDVPVLTIEEPTSGPDPTTISINPDLSDPGLPLECTFLWTPAPGMPPEAIADTIIAVLKPSALQPPRIAPATRSVSPMTARRRRMPASDDDLTARIFRALYQEFDLRALNGTSCRAERHSMVRRTQSRRHRPPDQRPRPPGPGGFPRPARAHRRYTSC